MSDLAVTFTSPVCATCQSTGEPFLPYTRYSADNLSVFLSHNGNAYCFVQKPYAESPPYNATAMTDAQVAALSAPDVGPQQPVVFVTLDADQKDHAWIQGHEVYMASTGDGKFSESPGTVVLPATCNHQGKHGLNTLGHTLSAHLADWDGDLTELKTIVVENVAMERSQLPNDFSVIVSKDGISHIFRSHHRKWSQEVEKGGTTPWTQLHGQARQKAIDQLKSSVGKPSS